MSIFAENFNCLMNTIRTFVVSALMAIACLSAHADDFHYLTIDQSNGEVSFVVSDISKITFDATNMVLHLSNGNTQSVPLSGLSRMFFAGNPASIDAVPTTKSKIQFSEGMLRATVAPGESITIYNMKGEQVFSSNETGIFDMKTFTKGVYIIKVGKETKKVINK